LRELPNKEFCIPKNILGQGLFYRAKRNNVWKLCNLSNRVNVVRAEVVGFSVTNNSTIRSLILRDNTGTRELGGDLSVLDTGGIGTLLLLQELAKVIAIPSLSIAGAYY
jgi:hypothetical protein